VGFMRSLHEVREVNSAVRIISLRVSASVRECVSVNMSASA